MGKSQRDKGARGERDFVNRWKAAGREAKRMPLSGAARGFKGDALVEIRGEPWRFENKWRADGFKQIYSWLGDNHALAIKADGKPWLIVTPVDRFIEVTSTCSTISFSSS